MGVAARDNSYGSHNFYDDWDNEWRDHQRNGAIITSHHPVHPEVHACGRRNHTSNPPHTVAGVSDYRSPSNYGRYVYESKPIKGVWTWNYTGTNTSQNQIVFSEKIGPFTLGAIDEIAWPVHWANPEPNEGGVEFTNMMGRCTTECLAKLGDMKANYMEDMVESLRTWRSFTKLALTGFEALVAFREGNLPKLARLLGVKDLRKLSGRYLEYTYGWAPLIGDIIGTHELFKQHLSGSNLVSVKRSISTSFTDDASGKSSKGVQGTASCSMGLVGRISDDYLRIAQQVGLTNPLLLGWELIPYSFIVDWFMPVGNYIKAMQARKGLTFVSGWKNYRVESSSRYIATPDAGWKEQSPRGVSSTGFAFKRIALTGFPQPIPYTKSPFGTVHAVNLTALLHQRFGR